MAEINARNKALIEGHTICNICFELYDAEACGKRAPITSPCCGQSACRQCVDKFHAVKQEAASRVKYFPCLFCNTEKAFHIDKLPTPHYGFIALISMCRQLQSDNSQQLAILDEKLAKMIAEASKSAAEKNIAEETAAELKEKLSARERLLIQQSEMHVRSLEDARSEIDGLKTEISSVEGRLRASEQDNDCLKLKLVELGTKSQITQDHSIASVHSVSQESAELSRCHSKEIPSLTLTQPEELGLVQTTLKEPISPSPPSHLIEDPTLSPGNSLKKSAKDEACVPFTTCKKNDKTKKTSKRAVVRSETSFLLDFETIPAEKFFAFSHPTNSVCLSDLVKLRPEDIFIASSTSEHKSNCHTVYLRSANSECIIGEYENIDGDDLGSGERLSKRACLEVTDARSLAQCSEPTTIPNSEPAREELQVNFREFTLNLSRLMRMLREVCADKLEEIYDLHFAGKFAPFSSYRRPGEALESLFQRFVENGNCRLETRNSTLILVSTTNDLDVEEMSSDLPHEVVAIENDVCSERSSSELLMLDRERSLAYENNEGNESEGEVGDNGVPILSRSGSLDHYEVLENLDGSRSGHIGAPILERLGSTVQNKPEDIDIEFKNTDGGVPILQRLGSSVQNEPEDAVIGNVEVSILERLGSSVQTEQFLACNDDEIESTIGRESEYEVEMDEIHEDNIVDRRIFVENENVSSKVFVRNIPPSCTEFELRECFHQFMQDTSGREMGVYKPENRRFAHIYLRSRVAASMAISASLNEGIFLGKSHLVVEPLHSSKKAASFSNTDHLNEPKAERWKSGIRCRFLDTKEGCFSGSECKFKHD